MANCNVNTHERFADIQMLRYELKGFDALSLNQKLYIYCLAKATLMGRRSTSRESTTCAFAKPWRQSIAITRESAERLSKTQRQHAILLLKSKLLLYAIPKNSRLSKYI